MCWMSVTCLSAFCGIPNYTGYCLSNLFFIEFFKKVHHPSKFCMAFWQGCHTANHSKYIFTDGGSNPVPHSSENCVLTVMHRRVRCWVRVTIGEDLFSMVWCLVTWPKGHTKLWQVMNFKDSINTYPVVECIWKNLITCLHSFLYLWWILLAEGCQCKYKRVVHKKIMHNT